jgi:hypothetical protein
MTTGLPTQNFVFKTDIAMKQGALVKNWKQRLLILDGASLRYYQPVDKGWPRGTIPLALILGVLEVGNELPDPRDHNTTTTHTPAHTHIAHGTRL